MGNSIQEGEHCLCKGPGVGEDVVHLRNCDLRGTSACEGEGEWWARRMGCTAAHTTVRWGLDSFLWGIGNHGKISDSGGTYKN